MNRTCTDAEEERRGREGSGTCEGKEARMWETQLRCVAPAGDESQGR